MVSVKWKKKAFWLKEIRERNKKKNHYNCIDKVGLSMPSYLRKSCALCSTFYLYMAIQGLPQLFIISHNTTSLLHIHSSCHYILGQNNIMQRDNIKIKWRTGKRENQYPNIQFEVWIVCLHVSKSWSARSL